MRFEVLLTVHLSIFIVLLTVHLSIFIVLLTVHLSIFIVLLTVHLSIFIVLLTVHLTIFIVLLTVHLSIYISVINQLDAKHFSFTISLFHASTCFEHYCAHHQEVRIVLYSLWHHHTYRWPSGANNLIILCTRQPPLSVYLSQ